MFSSLKQVEERGERSSGAAMTSSRTMIHCVAQAFALRPRRSISFIWHFMAVRSQWLSKGGRSADSPLRALRGEEPGGGGRGAGGRGVKEGSTLLRESESVRGRDGRK